MTWHQTLLADQPQLSSLAERHRSQHGIHFRRADGLIEAHISCAPVYHEADPNNWQPIDTTLVAEGQYRRPTGLPVRLHTNTGRVEIIGTPYQQTTQEVGYFKDGTFVAWGGFSNVQKKISANCLYAETKAFRYELRVTETGIIETLRLNALPKGGLPNADFGLKTLISGLALPSGTITGQYNIRPYRTKPILVRDAQRNLALCQQWVQIEEGQQYLYTLLPTAWLETAVYPVIIDLDITASDPADLFGSDPDYATSRATAAYIDAGYDFIGQYLPGPPENLIQLGRMAYKFDTSSIPVGANVISAYLKMKFSGIGIDPNNAHFDVQIVEYDWSAYDPITSGNGDTVYDGILSPSAYILLRNTDGMVADTQYTSSALTSSYIQKGGATYYGVRSSREKAGNQPVDPNEWVDLVNYDHLETPTYYYPILVVSYNYPGIYHHPYRKLRI